MKEENHRIGKEDGRQSEDIKEELRGEGRKRTVQTGQWGEEAIWDDALKKQGTKSYELEIKVPEEPPPHREWEYVYKGDP